jgi:8-oxo-dGTP diphosphatase
VEFTEYDTRLAAYAVVADAEGRVLLARWNQHDRQLWTMAGGAVELYEGPEQAAVRELEEETGFVVALTELLGIDAHVLDAEKRWADTNRPLKFVQVIYRAKIVGGALRNEVGGTTDEARWFALSEVETLPRAGIVDRALSLAGLMDGGPDG